MRGLIGLLLVGAIGCSAGSQHHHHKPAEQKMPTHAEMQEAFKRASTIGIHHRALDALPGKYTFTAEFRMDPEGPAETDAGTTEFAWILDKHFVQQTYKGRFHGKPFEGRQLLGYNNLSERYESVWADSMSTQLMLSHGTADESGKVISFSGTYHCPVRGKRESTSVFRLGTDTHSFEMWDEGSDGKKFKAFEVIYRRVGSKARAVSKNRSKKS